VTVTVLGIRHHGPGSARAVRSALSALRPDVVLIEGPPEADGLVQHVPGLVPPVAILAHASELPGRAAFWPLAEFSPEWQAMHYCTETGTPARFIDLPAGVTLAGTRPDPALAADRPDHELPDQADSDEPGPGPGGGPDHVEDDESADRTIARQVSAVADDPIGWLSRAAGHDDPERWWEDVVEHRLGGNPLELFAAVAEAMAALREEATADGWQPSGREQQREAAMRQGIRAAVRAGHDQIAVICGAWHAPALAVLPPASHDAALLRGLPKVKTGATWVPWTSQRLTQASGYGAGVASPAWYAHLWRVPDRSTERWLVRAAMLLREADLPASPASVLEAVRLAEAVAAVRGRSLPGLSEVTDAALAVLCHGDEVPLGLISRSLVVGEELGEVPPSVPMVPLQADFEAWCRRLRLRPQAADRDLVLDLRHENDRARSALLHRLRLLSVPWGAMVSAPGQGTFKEGWRLRWQPEFLVSLIERARYGTTIAAAASSAVIEQAATAAALPEITGLIEAVALADLPAAMTAVTSALEQRSARTGDVRQLMTAAVPLARVLRYGDVRQTSTEVIGRVLDSLLVRICAGLQAACGSLDDDAAAAMLVALEAAENAIMLVGTEAQAAAWRSAQLSVSDLRGAPGLITGRCARLLLDARQLTAADAQVRLARVLSARDQAGNAVRWLEGFLRGSGLLLLRDEALWQMLDEWLCGLAAAEFDEFLPLLRRTFAEFPWPERRQMGERVRAGAAAATGISGGDEWDAGRIGRVLPVLATALGAELTNA
jgi:hypothetical protein